MNFNIGIVKIFFINYYLFFTRYKNFTFIQLVKFKYACFKLFQRQLIRLKQDYKL